MKRIGRAPLISLFFLLLSACLKNGGESTPATLGSPTRPQSNAQGFYGVFASGTNAFPRCGLSRKSGQADPIRVDCRLTVLASDGNEVEAIGIAPDTSIEWFSPVQVSGPPVKDVRCDVSSDRLSQSCEVVLNADTGTPAEIAKLEFSLQATYLGATLAPAATALSLVSAMSFGVVPHLPAFQPLEGRGGVGRPLGNQLPLFSPTETTFGAIGGMCTSGDRFFFATPTYIFVLQGGKVRLFAGSSNRANRENFSSRLDIALGSQSISGRPRPLSLTCSPDGLLVHEPGRLLLINESGPVLNVGESLPAAFLSAPPVLGPGSALFNVPLTPLTTDGVVRYVRGTSPEVLVPLLDADSRSGSAYAIDGNSLYLSLKVKSQIWRIDLTRKTAEVLVGNGGLITDSSLHEPSAIETLDDRSLYFIDKSGTQLRRLQNGILSTILGPGAGSAAKCDGPRTAGSWEERGCLFSALGKGPQGEILVATEAHTVLRILPNGLPERFLGKSFMIDGSSSGEQALSQSDFQSVNSIAFQGDEILAAEWFGGLRRLQPEKDRVQSAELNGATLLSSIRVTRGGDLLFATRGAIRRKRASGEIESVCEPRGGTEDGSPAISFEAGRAFGLVEASNGTIYFASGHAIFRIDPSSKKVYRVAGTKDVAGFSGDGGEARSALFGDINDLDVGGEFLYIADSSNHRVRRIHLATGLVATIAGGGTLESENPLELELKSPRALRVTSRGDVFIADTGNFALRLLKANPVGSGMNAFTAVRIVGKLQASQGACSGYIIKKAQATDEDAILASIENFCQAVPVALDLRERNGKVEVIYSQAFELFRDAYPSNIVSLSLPLY